MSLLDLDDDYVVFTSKESNNKKRKNLHCSKPLENGHIFLLISFFPILVVKICAMSHFVVAHSSGTE